MLKRLFVGFWILATLLPMHIFADDLEYIQSETNRILELKADDRDSAVQDYFDRLTSLPQKRDDDGEIIELILALRKLLELGSSKQSQRLRSRINDNAETAEKRVLAALIFAPSLNATERSTFESLLLSKNFQLDFFDENLWDYIPQFTKMVSPSFVKNLRTKLKSSDEFEIKAALELLRFGSAEQLRESGVTSSDILATVERENPSLNYHAYSLLTKFPYDPGLAQRLNISVERGIPTGFYLGGTMSSLGTQEKNSVTFDVQQKILQVKAELQYLAGFPESRKRLIDRIFDPLEKPRVKQLLRFGLFEYMAFHSSRSEMINFYKSYQERSLKYFQDQKINRNIPDLLSYNVAGLLSNEEVETYLAPGLKDKDFRVREATLDALTSEYALDASEPETPSRNLSDSTLKEMLVVFDEYSRSTSRALDFPGINQIFSGRHDGPSITERLQSFVSTKGSSPTLRGSAMRALLMQENGLSLETRKQLIDRSIRSAEASEQCALAGAFTVRAIERTPNAEELTKFFNNKKLTDECREHVLNGLIWLAGPLNTIEENDKLLKLLETLKVNFPKSKTAELAQTLMVKIYESDKRSFKELIAEHLNKDMMGKDPCKLVCDLAVKDEWFNPVADKEDFNERRVYASTAAYKTLFWLFKYRASLLCPDLQNWPKEFFLALQKDSNGIRSLDHKIIDYWESFVTKDDLASKTYYNSFDMYVVSFGAQYLREILANKNVAIDAALRQRLEKVQTALGRHRDSLLEKPSFNTFLGRELTGDSRLQTYAFSLGLNSLTSKELQQPNERQAHALELAKTMYRRLNNKLGIPYNPGLAAREVTSRAASARGVPFYLFLFRSEPEKRENAQLLFDSIKNYHIHLADLIGHFLKDGFHDGNDALGSHYYYPTFPYVGASIRELEKSPLLDANQKETLSTMKTDFLNTHQSLINSQGLFTPMGFSPKESISHQNSDAYSQPLGALGLMSFVDSCTNAKESHTIIPHE